MTSSLTNQLTTLSDSLASTNTLITRLSTLTFHPGSEPLSDVSTSTSVRLELAQDIHENLKQLEEDLEFLKQEVDDLSFSTSSSYPAGLRTRRESVTTEPKREIARLNAQVTKLGEDFQLSRAQFRRAQLDAKKAAEIAQLKEREAVFASLSNPPPPSPSSPHEAADPSSLLFAARRTKPVSQKSQQQQEIDATTTITTSLRRTHALLTTELSRSRFAQETFDQSTAALADLGEKYTNLDDILKGSRELLGTLLRSQKSDTWYLETAFWILVGTLGWLVFRRLLLGPFVRVPLFLISVLNWVVWKPLLGVLYLTGVVGRKEAVPVSGSAYSSSTLTRPPLIVQPSAATSGGIPRFDEDMAERMREKGGVPVGAGGAHAKHRQEGPVLEGEVSEEIGKMAEEGREEGGGGDGRRRGDGTLLEERGDHVPPNPKKKVFQVEEEDKKYAQQQQQQQQKTDGSERDEL